MGLPSHGPRGLLGFEFLVMVKESSIPASGLNVGPNFGPFSNALWVTVPMSVPVSVLNLSILPPHLHLGA